MDFGGDPQKWSTLVGIISVFLNLISVLSIELVVIDHGLDGRVGVIGQDVKEGEQIDPSSKFHENRRHGVLIGRRWPDKAKL